MAIQLTSSLTTTRVRKGDIILNRVEELIPLHNNGYSEYASMVHACDLFFTLDYWLKYYKTVPGYETDQVGAVTELYGTVVRLLCMAFKTTVNVLPRELETMFGRELTAAGVNVDVTQGLAKFAQDGEIKKYRLFFDNGKIYQFPWWETNYTDGAKVECESAKSQPDAQMHTAASGGDQVNWGYCVMSMNREFYMTKHSPAAVDLEYKTSGGDNFSRIKSVPAQGIYHSYYLPGVAVMFSGSVLVEKGKLIGIANNSGHYKPTENNLLAALQAMQMYNVPLADVAIYDHNARYTCLAPQFLSCSGKWSNLKSNQKQSQWLNEMAWAERQNPKVHKWVKLRGPVPYAEKVQIEDVQPPRNVPPVNLNPLPVAQPVTVQDDGEQTNYTIVTMDLNDTTQPGEEVVPYN